MDILGNDVTLYLLQQELAALRNKGVATEKTINDKLMVEMSNLSTEEFTMITSMDEYKQADLLYWSVFNTFIGDKFKHEFIATTDGLKVSENLLNTLKTCKQSYASTVEQERKEFEEYKAWKKQQTLNTEEHDDEE